MTQTTLRYAAGSQFLDDGDPVALGELRYRIAGSSTPLATFADVAGTVQNPDPIILNASGILPCAVYLLQGGDYREVLNSSIGAAITGWPIDNVSTSTETFAVFEGDSGTGGAAGAVPAPAAGDAAGSKFLKASGAWVRPAAADISGLGSFATLSSLASTGLSDKTTAGTNMFTAANVAAQTALLNAVVGDTGSGGTKGMVPAPASGDAAGSKFLAASGAWVRPAAADISGLAASATTDTTSATNITSGSLPAAQLPTGLTLSSGVLASTGTASASAKAMTAHGAAFEMKVLEDTVTLSGASTNAAITIPPGAIVFACPARVTTEITGSGVTSWEIGYTAALGAFGSTLPLAAGTVNIGNIGGQGFYGSPTAITITAAGGSFTGGVVRIALCYLLPSVPAS